MKYDERPFSSVAEMNETMIERHNEVVKPNDEVYTVGDFCFGGTHDWEQIKKRLNGQWFLIKGNHDRQSFAFLRNLFVAVNEIKNLRVGSQTIVLSHFPMYTWDKSHYGSYHCHGHEHGHIKDSYDQTGKILDVGVNTNNYYPYSMNEVLEIMKGKPDNWNQLKGHRT
jgi:calcineurin-like phosphoesterase family protein